MPDAPTRTSAGPRLRRTPVAVAGVLLALLALAAAAAPAGAAGPGLVANGSFERDTAGWGAFHGSVARLEGRSDAPDGDAVAEVRASPGTREDLTLDDEPASVPRVDRARPYVGTAWVRTGSAGSAGRPVRLLLRTTGPGGSAGTCGASPTHRLSGTWTLLRAVCRPSRAGDALDVYVAREGAVAEDERFLVDAVGLTRPPLAPVPAGNRTEDPSFAASPTPWAARGALLRPIRAPVEAPEGDTVGELVAGLPRDRGPIVVGTPRPAVLATAAATTYAGRAWVRWGGPRRPFAPPVRARLVLRETTPRGGVVRTSSVPVLLDAGRWRRVEAAVVPSPGHRLDLTVELDGPLGVGERVLLDGATLEPVPLASAFGSATTLRPDRPLPPGGAPVADVAAAGNETASVQIALRTAGVPLSGVRIALDGPLRGPAGARLPASAVTLAREASYRVEVPSDVEGDAGLWPDALVPDRDPLLGGDGGAFPLTLSARDAGAVWVDVAVPPDARPGSYAGTLRVSTDGPVVAEVPVRLEVRPFVLPATSSLRSLFVLNPYAVCSRSAGAGDGGYARIRRPDGAGCDAEDEETWRVFARFAALGLRNRITIANPYPTPRMVAPTREDRIVPRPARPGAPRTGADAFERYVRPLVAGTAGQGTLPGARLTTLTTQWECLEAQGAACTAGWRALLRDRAPEAEARFLPWVCDEPAFDDDAHFSPWRGDPAEVGTCENDRRTARRGWPGVPIKITTAIDDPGLYGGGPVDPSRLTREVVDVLGPNVVDLVTRAGGSTRARYDERPAGSPAPWFYLSCASAGCDPGRRAGDRTPFSPEDRGWPSYAIDQPGSQASAAGWMAFVYRLGGESLFDVAAGFDEGPAFRYGIDTYGANGDGLLFTPGSVVVPGPRGPRRELVPRETIRLKRIREGREDYEVLRRLERCGRRAEGLAVATRLFGDADRAMVSTTVSQERLDDARDELAALVVRHGC